MKNKNKETYGQYFTSRKNLLITIVGVLVLLTIFNMISLGILLAYIVLFLIVIVSILTYLRCLRLYSRKKTIIEDYLLIELLIFFLEIIVYATIILFVAYLNNFDSPIYILNIICFSALMFIILVFFIDLNNFLIRKLDEVKVSISENLEENILDVRALSQKISDFHRRKINGEIEKLEEGFDEWELKEN